MLNANGNIWKIIGTLLGSGIIITIAAWIWQASTIASRVENNCEEITTLKAEIKADIEPIVQTNHDAIIGIKKDIIQILAAQQRIEQNEKQSKKDILDAIKELADGN